MDIKEIERIVTGLQTRLFKNSNSYSSGIFKSQFKGSGLQFKEHQIYTHGDDVRFIDWRQSAKSQKTYIKTFEEERNVEVHAVIDMSPSMVLGYRGKSKFQSIVEIVALVYLITGKIQDLTSLHIWAEKDLRLPKTSGRKGIVQMITSLKRANILNEEGEINHNYSFNQEKTEEDKIIWLKKMLTQRKEVMLLTDFSQMNQVSKWESLLAHPYLHAFQVLSPIELMEKKDIFFQSKSSGWGTLKTQNIGEWDKYKRVHKLRTDEKYLENFVKEMMKA